MKTLLDQPIYAYPDQAFLTKLAFLTKNINDDSESKHVSFLNTNSLVKLQYLQFAFLENLQFLS